MVARAAAQRVDRRGQIAKALYACIARKGYAATTLTDVAQEAGMTPSHVGYYFDNKAAILEHFAASLSEQMEARSPGLSEPDPERLIDAVADFRFGEGQLSRSFLGVLQEFAGLAVHDPRFHRIKASHVAAWQRYFEAMFERLPRARGLRAFDAAALAHALAVGLHTNVLFDERLTREEARRLFRRALRMLSGIEDDGPTRALGARAARGPLARRPARTGGKR